MTTASRNQKSFKVKEKHVNSNRKRKIRLSRVFSMICVILSFLITYSIWASHYVISHHNVSSQYQYGDSFLSPLYNNFQSTFTAPKYVQGHACDGYQGVYHIAMGDIGGAAGTIFFQFVIGQLIWAEKYNFKPWVYFNNVSYIVYDPIVHGGGPGVNFIMLGGMNVSYVQRPNGVCVSDCQATPLVFLLEVEFLTLSFIFTLFFFEINSTRRIMYPGLQKFQTS